MALSGKTEADLQKLDAHLAQNAYVSGDLPAPEDNRVFNEIKKAPLHSRYPNAHAWFAHLSQYTAEVRASWTEAKKKGGDKKSKDNKKDKKEAKKETKKEEEEEEDMDDLFGDSDDGEDAAAAAKALADKKKAENKTKKDEKKVITKSLVIFDVKVWESDQDLDALAKKVLAITMEGLTWKSEYKTPEVAFGIKKLQIGCVVIDDDCSVDGIQEAIEAFEDDVQSVDIASFSKL
mmetsp:Transcript_45744/g.52725  ORF Transcript_45744/g.52725 Transcript_45744/m.52725 type:complete len:234 (+) Transcript_45744:77-778(+)|eukprot:CAMPEP_0115013452 /NCGR_PEP_ID=MMETSP0216-20121206/25418_1 /TAXON_ID=223996 /ORGANISM="Protocruzia adherens, Strain Boccale" /LENGTH=233 /DNA_ID=CAMNT_0002382857 /DNA_START=48 /DNA_END=749 /DNA_ORIENTATION=+